MDSGVSDLNKGLILAISSSLFIGSSFIVKKKGLRRAGATGLRAGPWEELHGLGRDRIPVPCTSAALHGSCRQPAHGAPAQSVAWIAP